MMKHAFPDPQAHIEEIVAAKDKVAVRLQFRGTQCGEFLGIPATGRTIKYVSHEFYRVADRLLAEEWICSDMATLLASSADPAPMTTWHAPLELQSPR